MADRTLRGARLGAPSLQREDGVVLAQRQFVRFVCANCGEPSDLMFSVDAEVPDSWECRHCGQRAIREGVSVSDEDAAPPAASGRTPWEMLLERRSIPELEDILQERLEWLRARRGNESLE